MKNIKTGYKVTTTDNLSYGASCNISLKYDLNKKTYHNLKNGALALFDTINNAKNFLSEHTMFQGIIWKAIYKPEPNPIARYLYYPSSYEYHPITDEKDDGLYWYIGIKDTRIFNKKDILNNSLTFQYKELPKGTVFARWIKLLEKIGDDFFD